MGSSTVMNSLTGRQITASENHPSWNKPRKAGYFKGDVGGPFFSQKRYAIGGGTTSWSKFVFDKSLGRGTLTALFGPFLPIAPSSMPFPPSMQSTEDSMDELGATAIARCAPANPAANLSQFLGELVKEGLPSLIGSTLLKWRNLSSQERRRAIGKEYLSYEFGWKPIANDLAEISHAIIHADAIWRQYERDAGKLVRRKYEFPEYTDESWSTVSQEVRPWTNPSTTTFYDLSVPRTELGRVIRHRKVTRRQWFSGAFTYVLPDGSRAIRDHGAKNVLMAKKTLGLALTPDTVWNLTPWSWAVDWFTNVGDNLQNFSNWAFDGQVLRYGYIMEHTMVEDTYTYVGNTGLIPGCGRPAPVTLVTETKVRRQASPFGFGIQASDFTTRQKAIVAALGISRSK